MTTDDQKHRNDMIALTAVYEAEIGKLKGDVMAVIQDKRREYQAGSSGRVNHGLIANLPRILNPMRGRAIRTGAL